MSKNISKYGGKPPKIDVRDYKIAKFFCPIPEEYTLSNLPKVKNQQQVRSCVAHAMSSILEYFDENHSKLSTNFIYGSQRKLFNYTGTGMYLQNACKIAQKYGDMLEKDCKGNNEVPVCWRIAEEALYDSEKTERASAYKVKNYFNCNDTEDIKKAIFRYGPVLGSIKWYDDYQCDDNGVLSRDANKKSSYGYHAVMVYGWNKQGFLCQNSWGEEWGNKGHFTLPYLIPFAEAKGFADAEDGNVIIPKTNKKLNVVYKGINCILKLFNKR